jgi:hypothetical protein
MRDEKRLRRGDERGVVRAGLLLETAEVLLVSAIAAPNDADAQLRRRDIGQRRGRG